MSTRRNPQNLRSIGTIVSYPLPGGGFWVLDDSRAEGCPFCGALAVVPLHQKLREAQADGTTHVCVTAFGGCNQGFVRECKLRPAFVQSEGAA